MAARWLTEEWNRESIKFPKWLRNQMLRKQLLYLPESPEKPAKKYALIYYTTTRMKYTCSQKYNKFINDRITC